MRRRKNFMTANEQQINKKKDLLNWGKRISKFQLAHLDLSFKRVLCITHVRSMQLLPQPRHPFPLVFTVPGFILLPSAWLRAILLANIHLGWIYQGRAPHCSLHGAPSEAHSSQMARALDSSCHLCFGEPVAPEASPLFSWL